MTEEEIKVTYLDWIQSHCNNSFDIKNLPGGIELALNQLIKIDPLKFNVTSEKLSDMSRTFASDGGIPSFIYEYLKPYKRVRSL